MTYQEFEKLVAQALDNLPQEFLDKLNNVEVVIEIWPNRRQLHLARVPSNNLLFGLYQGTPLTKRTSMNVFPDKITIFAGPILMVSRNHKQVKEKVREVVIHEIAHHFGMDETSIRKKGF